MKKIYTLTAAALCASVAFANGPVRTVASDNLTSALNNLEQAQVMTSTNSKKVEKKSETRADGWKSLGEGIYRETILSSMFRGIDAVPVAVEVEQNEADPNQYRLVNPYQNYEMPYTDVTYDATGTYYMYLTVCEYNGKKYWYMPEECRTGVVFPDLGNDLMGMATIMPMTGELVAANGVEACMQRFGEDSFGVYEDGAFTIPYQFMYNGQDMPNLLVHLATQEEGYGLKINQKEVFAVCLPGVSLPEPPDPFKSYNLVGECDMVNAILENFFEEATPAARKVTVYEEPNNPGYFHIKGAWGDWNLPEVAEVNDFSIDLTDPNFGLIPFTETGYVDEEQKLGDIDIVSSSYLMLYGIEEAITKSEFLAEYANENIYIDAATKRIIIPGDGIGYMTTATGNSVYGPVVDPAAQSWIQLPADYVLPESAVNEIDIDNENAPVEYYNLQGVKVLNPEAGALVIKKQGSKVSKLIVK